MHLRMDVYIYPGLADDPCWRLLCHQPYVPATALPRFFPPHRTSSAVADFFDLSSNFPNTPGLAPLMLTSVQALRRHPSPSLIRD